MKAAINRQIAAVLICLASAASADPPTDPAGWPMVGHDPQHTNRSAAYGPNGQLLRWNYDITYDNFWSDPEFEGFWDPYVFTQLTVDTAHNVYVTVVTYLDQPTHVASFADGGLHAASLRWIKDMTPYGSFQSGLYGLAIGHAAPTIIGDKLYVCWANAVVGGVGEGVPLAALKSMALGGGPVTSYPPALVGGAGTLSQAWHTGVVNYRREDGGALIPLRLRDDEGELVDVLACGIKLGVFGQVESPHPYPWVRVVFFDYPPDPLDSYFRPSVPVFVSDEEQQESAWADEITDIVATPGSELQGSRWFGAAVVYKPQGGDINGIGAYAQDEYLDVVWQPQWDRGEFYDGLLPDYYTAGACALDLGRQRFIVADSAAEPVGYTPPDIMPLTSYFLEAQPGDQWEWQTDFVGIDSTRPNKRGRAASPLALASDGTIYLSVEVVDWPDPDYGQRRVFRVAVDPVTGGWTVLAADRGGTPVVDGTDVVYFVGEGAEVYCYLQDGTEAWHFECPGSPEGDWCEELTFYGPALGPDGVLYLVGATSFWRTPEYLVAFGGCEFECPGDLNGDGARDVTDFSLFAAAMGSVFGDPEYNYKADLDCNRVVNVSDFTIFASYFGQPCP